MKCVFAIKSLAIAGGGAERVFVEVVNGLTARKHKVIALSYDKPNATAFYPLEPQVEWIRLGIGNTRQPTNALETTKRILSLRRTIAGLKPHIVVGFMHSVFIPLGLAMLGLGTPMIASEHIVPAHYARRPLQRFLLRLTPLYARRITVVSRQVMQEYPPGLRANMVVVPNPVQAAQVAQADPIGESRSRKLLLSVGRLTEQKDYPTLIDAFTLIADRVPDWDLRIVGEGECRNNLQERIVKAGLQERISLPGTTAEIWAEYANAQLFVLPSLYESQGLALAEALACGLPALGFTACTGVNSLIRPGRNGVLVSGADRVPSLADAMVSLMTDDQARVALSTTSFVPPEENHPERVLDRWEMLLHETLSTPSRR